jgi:predicted O-methyltransferase YrrM
VLFQLVRETQPDSCLELGTAVGISAAYQAAALRLNGRGRLITLEGGRSLADHAEGNLRALGLAEQVEVRAGRFSDTLGDALEDGDPFDYVFIDGHHEEQATVDYFLQVAPRMSIGGVMVFDDVDWSEGMARAWASIRQDPRVTATAAVGPLGICACCSR